MKLQALALMTGFMLASAAHAADHTVEMLNKGADGENHVFSPAIVYAEPGDTITFVSVDKGHNAETVKGAIPDGGEAWKTKISQEISVTVDAEGVYAIKCTPHFGMGMVGLIVVGDNIDNIDAVAEARYRGKAKDRMAAMIDEVKAKYAGSESPNS